MESVEEVLILKSGRFREKDLWLRLLSPKRGVFTAFAFGGCVSRRRFGGCLDPMDVTRFSVGRSKTGDYLQVQEGELVHRFQALRQDQTRLGMAVNCVKFAEAVLAGPEGAEESFSLLTGALGLLDSMRQDPKDIPLYFRARLMFEHGFAPALDACLRCGVGIDQMTLLSFDVDSGRIVCSECRALAAERPSFLVPASKGAIKTLARVQRAPVEEWATLSMSPAVRKECLELVDAYVGRHLGLEWDRTGYRRI